MKDPPNRTKVVLRHLPPALSQPMLMEQIDVAFAARYNWVTFRPGKNSQKQQSHSRAYIDFKSPEDVIQFAEFFDGHVFVNEKGTQFKTIVEYAPSQRTPKQWSKKDGREGTIYKDPEYMEFLEFLEKPIENLPSAEIQLEKREAERVGTTKDTPIVTPLMDFVRQKRAAKSGSRRSLSNGKLNRRAGGSSAGIRSPASSKRGSGKRRTTMYVLRESAKNTDGKDKSNYIPVPKRHDNQLSDKFVTRAPTAGIEVLEECGVSGITDGKKKVLLLKGKDREILNVSGGISQQHSITSSVKSTLSSTALKQTQQRECGGRIIKSILSNKDASKSQSSGVQSEQLWQTSSLEDKRHPRTPQVQSILKDTNTTSVDELHGFCGEKQKRIRNKERPDHGVWTLRRSEGSNASDESLTSFSQPTQSMLDSSEGSHGDMKIDVSNLGNVEVKTHGTGRSVHFSLDNGSHKHAGHRGPTYSVKDADGLVVTSEGKPSKRGGASNHGSHEKQVWVQKSSAGS